MSDQSKKLFPGGKSVDAQTFGSALGQAVWLMTMDPKYRDLPIREVETRVAMPIFLQQFKIYLRGKQPVAFLSWALASEEVKAKIESSETALELKDWRSGKHLVIVDCVSPFGDPSVFKQNLSDQIEHENKKSGANDV